MADGLMRPVYVLASTAAQRSIGPADIVLFGATMPVWSVFLGVAGALMARRVAPASAAEAALGRFGNHALTALTVLIVIALIVTGEKRPIVAMGWAIGLGYSGIGAIEVIARGMMAAGKAIMDGAATAATKGAAAWMQRREKD